MKPVTTLERRQQRPTRARQAPPSRVASRHAPASRPNPARAKRVRHTKVPRKRPGILVTFRAGDTRRRLLVVFIGSVLVLASVIGRVVYLQTAGSDRLVAAGKAQRTTSSILMAQRGTIFASDGGELALSVPSSTIMADPKMVSDATGEASVLASMLNLPAVKERALVAAFTDKSKSFVFVARQVEDSLAQSVMALNLAGVDVLREDKRTMPSGEVGRSLLGRTDIDGKGTAGLEMQYNALLTGTNGERVREHDNQGRSIPGSESVTQAPVPGDDLVLTLDRSLQFQVEQALVARVQKVKAKGGTVVVMNSKTGEIYAVANVQRDPKKPTDVNVTSANLAAVEAFEPGSVAKVFSLAATIDQGAANPDTTADVPGKLVFNRGTKWESTISDAEPHGTQTMTMRDIMVHSSNIGTYLLAKNIGSDTLAHYFDLFGFGHKTALDFPGETKGIIDPPSMWQGTEKVTVTFGYHYQASALQFTAAVNSVANGGLYVAPKMLKATIDATGDVRPTAASATHRVIKATTAKDMVSMMKDVVCYGTATGAKIPGISVAGKTGTAYKVQSTGGYGAKGNRAYRASFVGFFPADAPKVTILVSIDEPDPTSQDRFGGTASAPLFAQIAADAIHELKITPIPGDTGCPAKHATTP